MALPRLLSKEKQGANDLPSLFVRKLTDCSAGASSSRAVSVPVLLFSVLYGADAPSQAHRGRAGCLSESCFRPGASTRIPHGISSDCVLELADISDSLALECKYRSFHPLSDDDTKVPVRDYVSGNSRR